MLSEEEEKTIEHLKIAVKERNIIPLADEVSLVLNLIEKQSKEIEENKKYIVQLTDEQYRKLVDIIRDKTSKEWEDKIKAKMKEKEWSLENYDCTEADYKQSQAIGAWSVLQSLLEKE